jgi:ClpP class serine protease
LIAREVGKIAGKKPIVVSMGDAGGVGQAMRIAPPDRGRLLTITSSIGSSASKRVAWWNKIGVNARPVTLGPNALIWSPVHDFDDAQEARHRQHNESVDQWLTDISAA